MNVLPFVAASGFVAAVGQVALLRESLVVFDGNELTFGLLLANWLLWVAVGTWLGSRLRLSAPKALLGLKVICVVSAFSVYGLVLLARSLRLLLGLRLGELAPLPAPLSGGALVLAPLCLLVGAAFSFGCRAVEGGETGRRVYVAEALGAVAGGLAATFIFFPFLGSLQVAPLLVALVAVTLIASAATKLIRLASGLAIIAAAFLFTYSTHFDTLSRKWHWGALRVIAVRSSRYGDLVATRYLGQTSIFESGKLAASMGDPVAAEELAHLVLLQHPMPRCVLLIGGGFGGAPREMLRHGLTRLTYAEFDPALISLARSCLPRENTAFLSDHRVQLIAGDARPFLRNTALRFDVILASLPGPTTLLLNRYYTAEFFVECKRHLLPGGLLAHRARLVAARDFQVLLRLRPWYLGD